MCVQNLVPIGPQATTCIPSEGYTQKYCCCTKSIPIGYGIIDIPYNLRLLAYILRHGKKSRENIFAGGYFRGKIFSREDIFARRYFRVKSIFAKISSRENISNSLFSKFSSRENKVLYSIFLVVDVMIIWKFLKTQL